MSGETMSDETKEPRGPGAKVAGGRDGSDAGEGYRAPAFDDLEAEGAAAASPDSNLEAILDIPVTLSLEVGRAQISIRNLLQLNQGSVVALDRLAGEPLDVMVNGTLVAHGEVVVVNDKFGIRLTDVISARDRVKKLK